LFRVRFVPKEVSAMSVRRLPLFAGLLAAVLGAFLIGRESSPAPLAAVETLERADHRGAGRDAARGLVIVRSEFSAEETAERLTQAATQGGATVAADIDHAAAAAAAGLDLRPTRVLLIGNPRAGTPLMQASQTTGIDLPLKFLIYEDARGQVRLAYNSARYLKRRHRIRGQDELLRTIEDNQRKLAAAATEGG
jgi:YD repeat-containing protein